MPTKRKRPGRPRVHPTPKRLGPIRFDPTVYDRLTSYLAATPDETQRSVIEKGVTAYLDSVGA